MIWLVEAGGGEGALPTMACTGYLFQASGIYERVGTSLVDVCERLEISVV